MRGRLTSAARQHVVNLYNLPTADALDCQIQVASLLNNSSWMGKWNDLSDEHKGVKWYTTIQIPKFIYYFFYSTPQSLGRQSFLANVYESRVTPVMLALVATALNCALKEWAKGTKQSPAIEFKREFFFGTTHISTSTLASLTRCFIQLYTIIAFLAGGQ